MMAWVDLAVMMRHEVVQNESYFVLCYLVMAWVDYAIKMMMVRHNLGHEMVLLQVMSIMGH